MKYRIHLILILPNCLIILKFISLWIFCLPSKIRISFSSSLLTGHIERPHERNSVTLEKKGKESWGRSCENLLLLFSAKSYLTHFDPMDCSASGSSVLWSMGFSRQQYWSGLPFPSPGDLPDPGIEPASQALQADSLSRSNQGSSATRIVTGKRRQRSSVVERKKKGEFENKLELIQSGY